MRRALTTDTVLKRLAVLGTTLATVFFTILAGTAYANTQAAASATSSSSWYLALGDSVATGYQPDRGEDPQGGYVGHVLQVVRTSDPQTQLLNLACDGETSVTLVAGGKCQYQQGSQLAQALAFLNAHRSTTRLITVTIGGNDATPCLTDTNPGACVTAALNTLAANLGQALSAMHAAAPLAKIVVTNYYDPFLALWFTNPDLAGLSITLQGLLNTTIASVTAGIAATADVASAFQSTNTTLIRGVPTNVIMICLLTWMCSKNDDHPNDAGHALIASSVAVRLR